MLHLSCYLCLNYQILPELKININIYFVAYRLKVMNANFIELVLDCRLVILI